MPKPLIVGNWKMQLSNADSVRLANRIAHKIVPTAQAEVVLCPSFVAIPAVQTELAAIQSTKRHNIALGAQNVSQYENGAYTGEVSAEQLNGLVSYVIDGHSERRLRFGETSEVDGSKVAQCLEHGLKPILCIGETLLEREQDLTTTTVLAQFEAGLQHVTASEIDKLTIAYEPVWAIGSGELPAPEDVAEVAGEILSFVQNRYPHSKLTRLLYGGSVTSHNAQAFLDMPTIGGLLVGGASLNYIEFSKIVNLTVKNN
jgi:triosephosphate isomerase